MKRTRCIVPAGFALAASAWGTTARAGDCGESVSVAQFEDQVGRAEQSYEDLEEAEFLDLMRATLPPSLPCLDAPIPPDLAARYHWLVAVHNLAPDEDAAFQAILAAHALAAHDDRRLLGALPEDGDAWRLYRSVPDERIRHTLTRPDTGGIRFDGVETLERPIDQFTIVQYTDDSGAVTFTRYLLRDQVLEPYPGARTQDLRPALVLTADGGRAAGWDPRKPVVKGTLIGAGAVGISAAVFYALAIASKVRFEDPDASTSLDELRSLQSRTNALGVTADGLAVTAGVGVGAAVVMAAF